MDLFDGHIHSIHSLDGKMTFEEILKKSPCRVMSITDHDTMLGYSKYLLTQNLPDKKATLIRNNYSTLIPGVEVTCRIPDVLRKDGQKTLKVHLLVYMADYDSVFNKILKLKYKNDQQYEFGLAFHLGNKLGFKVNKVQIQNFINEQQKNHPEFQHLGKKNILDFLSYIKYDYTTHTREVANAIKSYESKQIERLDLDAYEIIKLANNAGGFCILAHPGNNLLKAQGNAKDVLKLLIKNGISGFEYECNSNNERMRNTLLNVVKNNKRPLLLTGGSDVHTITHKANIGYQKGREIRLSDNTEFYKLCKALNKKKLHQPLSKAEQKMIDSYILPHNGKIDTQLIYEKYKSQYIQLTSNFVNMIKPSQANRRKVDKLENTCKKYAQKMKLQEQVNLDIDEIIDEENIYESSDEYTLTK